MPWAGTVDIDLHNRPLGEDREGRAVYLKDIWPSDREIRQTIASCLTQQMFVEKYADVFRGGEHWDRIETAGGETYAWNGDSTYVQCPPYFTAMPLHPSPLADIRRARPLAILGPSVTTDHISPAGTIAADSPAGQYLQGRGVAVADFNSYGSRRGNHEVMMRGTFANIRLRNEMVPGVEGGYTRHWPSGRQLSIYDAAMEYRREGVPLVVLAGNEYGTGSSRDWAAKGTKLLGVMAVIAESFERIHRSNLVGMGVLPLQLPSDVSVQGLQLRGSELF